MHRVPISAALPRTVVVLGLVSLLNDASSEMITPLLPIFLTATLGAGSGHRRPGRGPGRSDLERAEARCRPAGRSWRRSEVARARGLRVVQCDAPPDRPGGGLEFGAAAALSRPCRQRVAHRAQGCADRRRHARSGSRPCLRLSPLDGSRGRRHWPVDRVRPAVDRRSTSSTCSSRRSCPACWCCCCSRLACRGAAFRGAAARVVCLALAARPAARDDRGRRLARARERAGGLRRAVGDAAPAWRCTGCRSSGRPQASPRC